MLILSCSDDLGQADRRAIDFRHPQAAKDCLVEVRIGAAGEERVELVEESEVDIIGFWGLAVPGGDVVAVEIDLNACQPSQCA